MGIAELEIPHHAGDLDQFAIGVEKHRKGMMRAGRIHHDKPHRKRRDPED